MPDGAAMCTLGQLIPGRGHNNNSGGSSHSHLGGSSMGDLPGMQHGSHRLFNSDHQRMSSGARSLLDSAELIGEDERSGGTGAECVGGRGVLRPHSTPATLLWLEANYEMADGVCIPRSTLYTHYVHFCGENGLQPVNAASFGKIIRQQFPLLTTRRLGTRGQSRYHYYGIAIRESSVYFELSYSRKGGSCASDGRREVVRQNGFNQQRHKLTTLLPEFPNIRDICLPVGVPADRVASFLMMYRTHCQRIFDTILRSSIDEVQNFLLHFWQGMPPHLLGILSTNVVINMVGVCDSILYRSICDVLMPSVLQSIPDNLLQLIQKFAVELEVWLQMALEDLPAPLRNLKLSLAHNFSQMLKRQSSLNHLCQAAQMVILNPDLTNQMLQDLRKVDLRAICRQTMYTMDKVEGSLITELITGFYQEFQQLLEGQVTIERYTEWLESIIERCILHPASSSMSGSSTCLRQLARQFLLVWTGFGTRVIRDMTLHSAPSFGSFHLLHLMFDDYVLHLVDILQLEDRSKEMLRNVNHDSPPDLEAHWESTDTGATTFAGGMPACPSSSLPEYTQIQHMADNTQAMPDMTHQSAVPGEYPTPAEPYPASYQYDGDFSNACKNPMRSYSYDSYNQVAMEAQGVVPEDAAPSNIPNEKSLKFMNASMPQYSPTDYNAGISPQFTISRRGEPHEIASADGANFQDQSGPIHSISPSNYYNCYEANSNYPIYRY